MSKSKDDGCCGQGCGCTDPMMSDKSIESMKDWYNINGKWYHCVTDETGRYIDGKLQADIMEQV